MDMVILHFFVIAIALGAASAIGVLVYETIKG